MTFPRIQPILVAGLLTAQILASNFALASDDEAVSDARSLSRAFRSASKTATPSVVTILTYGQNVPQPAAEVPGNPLAEKSEQAEQANGESETDSETLTGLGSGVIVSGDGRVITNNHVITGAKKVVIQLADDTRHTATEVRGDPASDVAVLRIDLPQRDGERSIAATLGDSDLMEIGDWVLAIGSPFKLEATVSAGIIMQKVAVWAESPGVDCSKPMLRSIQAIPVVRREFGRRGHRNQYRHRHSQRRIPGHWFRNPHQSSSLDCGRIVRTRQSSAGCHRNHDGGAKPSNRRYV